MTISIVKELDAVKSPSTKPGAAHIDVCDIEHGSGKRYQIGNLVSEIHLLENIESTGVTGFLHIKDNINMIQSGLIIGEELLWLRFRTKDTSDNFSVNYTKHPLYIHTVEDITIPETAGGSQSFIEYRLHFCSTELISNDRIRVSKSYQGTIGDIVEKILKEELQTIKPVETTNTMGLYKYTAPNLHPFDCIQDLLSPANCIDSLAIKGPQSAVTRNIFNGLNNDFIFFETSVRTDPSDGGFFFIPLQKRPMGGNDFPLTLNNSASTGSGDQTTDWTMAMLTTTSYDIIDEGDKWQTVSEGIWAAKHIKHNSTKKSFAIYEHDYLEHLTNNNHSALSKTPVYWPKGIAKTVSEYSDACLFFSSRASKNKSEIFSRKGHAAAAYPWSHPSPESTLTRRMQIGHVLGYQRIKCRTHGISGLQLGKICRTNFPPIGAASGTPEDTGIAGAKDVWGENRHDNEWIITKVGHHITTGGEDPSYWNTLEMANTFAGTKKSLPAYGGLG